MRPTMRYIFPVRIVAAALLGGAIILSLGSSPAPSPAETTGTPMPIATPAPALADAPPAWAAFEHLWAGVAGFRATITVYELKGSQAENLVFDYTFRKPSSVTAHVVKGPNAGATIVWGGGSTVVANRGTGLIALLKKTFSLHDPIVTTVRGSSIDQLSFGSMLAHAQETPGTISSTSGASIDGVPTASVTLLPTSSATNTGLTREIVDISTMTNMPVRVQGYDGPTLVRQVDFSNIKLNP